MTRSRTTTRAASAALAATALLLAACSSPDATAASDEWVPGPLDEFSARIWGFSLDVGESVTSQQEEQARLDAEHREMEAAIAACMAEYGFDYIPNENSGSVIVFDTGDGPQWGTREFAETFGLGISTDPWGTADGDQGMDLQDWHDPNQEQLDAMSEAEQEAWWEALWGPPQEGDEWDPTIAGCAGRAQAERWQDPSTDEEFGWLNEEMNRLWETIEADPRWSRLQADWASCMADAGHPGHTSSDEMQNALHEEWGRIQGWGDDSIWEGWDWEAFPEGPTPPEPDPAEVEAFTQREISIAIADHECRQQLAFSATQMEIIHDHQQQFVDRHGAELEAWATREEARRAAS